ncbi:MAG: RNA methyltransferase [Cyanobacteria bacterium J06642_11]
MVDSAAALIVCASLVEKIPNQAALCRSCEVLGVEQLILPAAESSWEFRKVAASAQQWQPLAYVPPRELAAWLQQQVTYTRVALTVESDAQSLQRYRFAEKTLLVLGRELTGIPRNVASLCDVALKIPQYGHVESLNVQTAAAIAIYEYNRQWR